ncbi:hypothetical protein [Leptospira borgpetersenii]|uniref:Uncharacterized protein n=1 Tax=Leptospira borgpetersenii str. Brem 328 TaxID=1049780 RepID=A0ABC9SHI7_LEPBO|nr:hypothetical protein [Leptospira borgpetersenii]EMN13880.1 hypothetical protein LEP1GSC055_0363 [Leptospira borgpetersenii str. Brem 307]EMN17177.1 hypothetical protein LEP1GSC056_0532 [Leptospira borgpetersenii str. Brem 328]
MIRKYESFLLNPIWRTENVFDSVVLDLIESSGQNRERSLYFPSKEREGGNFSFSIGNAPSFAQTFFGSAFSEGKGTDEKR